MSIDYGVKIENTIGMKVRIMAQKKMSIKRENVWIKTRENYLLKV